MSRGQVAPTFMLLASTLISCSALGRTADYAVLAQGQSGQSAITVVRMSQSHWYLSVQEFALVLVNSARGHFDRRSLIRSTWAKRNASTRVLFLVANKACWIPPEARSNRECAIETPRREMTKSERQSTEWREMAYQQAMDIEQQGLTDEMNIHGDMLFVDTVDAYRSLAQKMWAAMSWAARESRAQWLVKLDDDVVVDLSTLLHELRRHEPHRRVIGKLMHDGPIYRSGKWAELRYRSNSSAARYPQYPIGVGYGLSMDLVKVVSRIPVEEYAYSSEDVSVGIMAEQLGGVTMVEAWWWEYLWSQPRVWMPRECKYFVNFVTGAIPTFGQITGRNGAGLSEELQRFMWELKQCYLHEHHLLASESGCVEAVDKMRAMRDQFLACERPSKWSRRSMYHQSPETITVETAKMETACGEAYTLEETFANRMFTSLAPYRIDTMKETSPQDKTDL